ncbi:hypothetical protein Tco_1462743, partial [Tanacetum coccineum]
MICSYSNSAFDHDLDILDESRFLDLTIAAGGHDPVCVVLFMEVTGSGQQPIQSVKTSGFDKSFESDRMVFIYDVLAEFDAMNKGKQVLGHRFR